MESMHSDTGAQEMPTDREVGAVAERVRMRTRLQRLADQREAALAERLIRARADFECIVDHVRHHYRVKRIWQWGSLLDGRHFSERSDIDIALEGVESAAAYFAILADAEARTDLPVHVVELDKLHAAFAESIRARGKVVRGD